MGFLSRIFGGKPTDKTQPQHEGNRNPWAAASVMGRADETRVVAGALGDERTQAEYDTFCASFCHKPGVRFTEFLKQERVDKLLEWLDPQNDEPEPKAFVRLAVATMERGENFWDLPGLSMLLEGRWSAGGGPSEFSDHALSVLAQIVEKPIKVYYREQPGEQSPLLVKQYEPGHRTVKPRSSHDSGSAAWSADRFGTIPLRRVRLPCYPRSAVI